MSKIRKLLSAQFSEFWTSEKTTAIFLLGAALAVFFSRNYLRFANYVSKPINPVESYLIIGSDLVYFTCVVVLGLMALTFDIPYFTQRSVLEIVRTGKTNWIVSRVLFLILQVVLYNVFILGVTSLLSVVSANGLTWGQWSDSMHALVGPNKAVALNRFNLAWDYTGFLSSCSIWTALLLTILLNSAYCIILSLIVMIGNILLGNTKGWMAAAGVHIIGFSIIKNGTGTLYRVSFSLLNCARPAVLFGAAHGMDVRKAGITFALLVGGLLLPVRWLGKRLVQ